MRPAHSGHGRKVAVGELKGDATGRRTGRRSGPTCEMNQQGLHPVFRAMVAENSKALFRQGQTVQGDTANLQQDAGGLRGELDKFPGGDVDKLAVEHGASSGACNTAARLEQRKEAKYLTRPDGSDGGSVLAVQPRIRYERAQREEEDGRQGLPATLHSSVPRAGAARTEVQEGRNISRWNSRGRDSGGHRCSCFARHTLKTP